MKKQTYSDGDAVENQILELFEKEETLDEIDNFIKDNPSWPIRYHLSKDRENILNWYEFEKDSKILEIGAGCGAVTGTLLNNDIEVTAVELTKRRADIIRERFKNNPKLTVIDGNIHKQKLNIKYDYITLIGVLEYAGRFTQGETPFQSMLEETRTLLNKKGKLIIAIENKLGLKYWRGASEDHTDILFESLQDYPNYDGIRTFSKKEITELLELAGYRNIKFYYPVPDYKFCYEIFSEDYIPSKNHKVSSSLFPSPHPSTNYQLFDEQRVANTIQNAGLFEEFSNSFLIFAENE